MNIGPGLQLSGQARIVGDNTRADERYELSCCLVEPMTLGCLIVERSRESWELGKSGRQRRRLGRFEEGLNKPSDFNLMSRCNVRLSSSLRNTAPDENLGRGPILRLETRRAALPWSSPRLTRGSRRRIPGTSRMSIRSASALPFLDLGGALDSALVVSTRCGGLYASTHDRGCHCSR